MISARSYFPNAAHASSVGAVGAIISKTTTITG
jgi:hypothetical protein